MRHTLCAVLGACLLATGCSNCWQVPAKCAPPPPAPRDTLPKPDTTSTAHD